MLVKFKTIYILDVITGTIIKGKHIGHICTKYEELHNFNFLHSQYCKYDKFIMQGAYVYCKTKRTLNELCNLFLLMGGTFPPHRWLLLPENVVIMKDCIRLLVDMNKNEKSQDRSNQPGPMGS